MSAKLGLLGVVLAMFALPAHAVQFYIVQDSEQKQCSVTEQVPVGEKYAVVGDGAYGDQQVARSEMNALFVCNKTKDDSSSAPPERSAEPAKP
jgi:isocitrate dehydrogenase kinase/phosphatase